MQTVPHVVREEGVYDRLLKGIAPKAEELCHPKAPVPFQVDVQVRDNNAMQPTALSHKAGGSKRVAEPVSALPPTEQAASSSSVGVAVAVAAPAEISLQTDHKWGVFTITPRQPTSRCKHGSFPASCPFHKKSARTGCKKEMVIPSSAPADMHNTLMCIKHWCNMAKHYSTQWQHVLFHPRFLDTPALSVLQAQCINEAPREAVRADVELPPASAQRGHARDAERVPVAGASISERGSSQQSRG